MATNHHKPEHQWRDERRLEAENDAMAGMPLQLRWDTCDEAHDLRDRVERALAKQS